MSNCEEYMWLHQRYAQALRSWLRATNSPDTANDKAAEQERDARSAPYLSTQELPALNSGAGPVL